MSGIIRGLTINNGSVEQVNVGLCKSTDMVPTGLNAATYGDASHALIQTVDAGGRLSGLSVIPHVIRDQGGQVFNVMADKYGAKGDGATDDTAAIQSAINDALAVSGEVFFPPPVAGKTYLVTSTLNISGSGSAIRSLVMKASPNVVNHGQLITYNGPSNASVFASIGVTDSHFYNIGVCLASGLSNVVIWDHQFSATFPTGGSYNRYLKCNTTFVNNLNCIWMRFGQSSGGGASSAFDLVCDHCLVNDQTANSGTIAVQIGGSQAYAPSFYNCSLQCSCNILCGPVGSQLTGSVTQNVSTTIPVADTLLFPASGTISIGGNAAAYTSKSTSTGPGNLVLASTWTASTFGAGSQCSFSVSGQGVYGGNCSFRFHNGQLSGNSWGYDVLILTAGYCSLETLQCQNASPIQRRFLQVGTGAASSPVHVEIHQATLKNYLPVSTVDTHGLIWLHFNTTLEMDKCTINNGTTAFSKTSNAWLISNNGATAFGNIRMKDCDFFATFPFVDNSASGVGWPVEYNHVQLDNSSGNPTSVLNNDPHLYRTITATTYTVTTGNDYTIACDCTSNAITPTLPSCASCPAGWSYTFKKTDSTANAVTVTPNGTDKIDGASAFSLASQYKFITLVNDGVSNWANVGSN